MKKFFHLIALFLFLLPNLVSGQEVQSITISPLVFDLSADKGEILKESLKVYNPSDRSIKIKLTTEDFLPKGERGEVEIVELEPELENIISLAKWIKLEENEFILEPRQEKIINFTIEIPKDAEAGGKYGSLIVNVSGLGEIEGVGAKVLQKVASLILFSIKGKVEEKLVVLDFKGPNFREYGPINFSLRLENQGTVHLRPRGLVAITDWRNRKVADLPIPQLAVLPGAKRTIDINWDNRNIFGHFTATLVGSYGSKNEPLTATWTFWVWPLKITILIVLIAILFIYFLIKNRKRIKAAIKVLFSKEIQ